MNRRFIWNDDQDVSTRVLSQNITSNQSRSDYKTNLLLFSSFAIFITSILMIQTILLILIRMKNQIKSIKERDEKVIRFRADDGGEANIYDTCNPVD